MRTPEYWRRRGQNWNAHHFSAHEINAKKIIFRERKEDEKMIIRDLLWFTNANCKKRRITWRKVTVIELAQTMENIRTYQMYLNTVKLALSRVNFNRLKLWFFVAKRWNKQIIACFSGAPYSYHKRSKLMHAF